MTSNIHLDDALAAVDDQVILHAPTPAAVLAHLFGPDSVHWAFEPAGSEGTHLYVLYLADDRPEHGWWIVRLESWDDADLSWHYEQDKRNVLTHALCEGVLAGPTLSTADLLCAPKFLAEICLPVDYTTLGTWQEGRLIRTLLDQMPSQQGEATWTLLRLLSPQVAQHVEHQALLDNQEPLRAEIITLMSQYANEHGLSLYALPLPEAFMLAPRETWMDLLDAAAADIAEHGTLYEP